MQKSVQLITTFCGKAKKSINVVSLKKCYSICDNTYTIDVFMVDIKI